MSEAPTSGGRYVVVARRYRPQAFDDLVGQQHVATALRNAIETGRVGHAYLFTGARGGGKTSAARIFAKCLNCEIGPSPVPCDQCDSCQSVATGEDVDVLEIDGASNRGIDEVRQLRSNVHVRPSRSRHKVYIIDEVHMLTTPAFNALLKTLEEPPEHVKFIFCTTDPEKIPITVLSRCQRYDFAGIDTGSIVARLRQIVQSEGVPATDDALSLIARRAAGSMRDSQSLLEQLLAFGGDEITVDDVHEMLGTAGTELIDKLTERLIQRDAATSLSLLAEAVTGGVDPGQLTEQLLGHYRDLMAVCVGCHEDVLLHTGPDAADDLRRQAADLGLETILASIQVLDQALVRMRQTTHGRVVAEAALVRLCHLENLDALAELAARVKDGQPLHVSAPATASQPRSNPTADSSRGGKKKVDAEPPAHQATAQETPPASAAAPASLSDDSAESVWRQAVKNIGGMFEEWGLKFNRIAISAPNRLVVQFPAKYNSAKTFCERAERKSQIENELSSIVGGPVTVEFRLDEAAAAPQPKRPTVRSTRENVREAMQHPLVAEAMDLFDAEVTTVDVGGQKRD